MTQARFYNTNGLSIQEIVGEAANFFQRDGFDTYINTDYAGRTVLQIGKQRGARVLFGLNYSLTVVVTSQQNDQVLVELGGESWGDKVGAGAIGAIFITPLLFTAAYGAWQQAELDDRFWAFLDGYIYQRTGRPAQPTNAVPYYNYNNPVGGGATPAPEGDINSDFKQFFTAPPQPTSQPYNYQAYQNYTYGYAPQGQGNSQPRYTPPNIQTGPQRASWFDEKGMQPIFDQQVGKIASWQAAIADGIITPQELTEQQDHVERLQKQVEDRLDTNQRLKMAETLRELDRLEQLQRTALGKSLTGSSSPTVNP